MRKVTIFAAPILALALVSALWPTAHPYVDRLGDNVYETIWLWRIPAYVQQSGFGVFAGPLAIHFERRRDVARRCNLLPRQASICELRQPPVDRKACPGWLKPDIFFFSPGNSPRSFRADRRTRTHAG